jgi:protein-disulfide isomerase
VFGPSSIRESVPGYVFAMSTGALAVVLYLIYVSIVVLKVYCVLCLVTDAAVVGLFIVSGAATSFPMTTLHRRAIRDLRAAIASPLAIVIAVLFFGAAASAVALFPREGAALDPQASSAVQEADRRSEFERWYAAQPRVPIVVPAEGAKVLIVDFSDFQCPFCKQAYESLKPILAKYNAQQPGAVKLVLKDFPLDSKCNANVQNGGPHPAACEAAVAVRLARAKNRDQALEDWLFANQPSMTSETVRKAAREIGQVTDFQEKYASTIELVKGDIDFGHSLNVGATPTLFINGVRIAGVLAPPYLDRAIELELQRATAK